MIRRYAHNPILTKSDIPYPVETVHNAAVVKHENEYIMLFRSHLRTGRSISAWPAARRIPLHCRSGALSRSCGPEEYSVEDHESPVSRASTSSPIASTREMESGSPWRKPGNSVRWRASL